MRRASSSLVLAATVAIVTLHPLAARQGQQPFRVGANFVRVDAYPMKDGQIVTGLEAADFEVLEDGVVQKIDTFEHIAVTREAYIARREPSSQAEMNREVGNPRSRVFLLFLDGPNVNWEDATAIREPLQKFLRDYLGDDDLVGVMTPGMSAAQVTYGRRTEVIENGLRGTWTWGRRNREMDPELDVRLIQYGLCYPHTDVGGKMVARARERVTLEALQDAVKHLHSLREERKAIVAVTEGWPLYREDPDLLRKREKEQPIGIDRIKAGPTGTLTTADPRNNINTLPPEQCDRDRAFLASIDDEKFLREIIDDANRGNASFYMIDPGGLRTGRPADWSSAMRTLAENTDGAALLNTNDLERGFKRMSDDMSSYYLLGYYASNTKTDGRYRTITVRVKQPGVTVRARKGYRAPTAAEIAAVERRAPAVPVSAEARSVAESLAGLARIRPDARFRINAALFSSATHAVWIGGEVQSLGGRPDEFLEGATALLEVVGAGVSASTTVTLKPGERTFLTRIEVPSAPSGTLDVRGRLTSVEGKSVPLTDAVRLDLERTPIQTLLYRRGVTTGNRLQPAGDPRFSRIERLRLEIPSGPVPADGTATAGRVIDRGGLTTKVPVTVGERVDAATSQRWLTADVTLGALSPGDYIVELTIQRAGAEHRVQTAIRVER